MIEKEIIIEAIKGFKLDNSLLPESETGTIYRNELAITALEQMLPRKVESLTYKPLLREGYKHSCPTCGCAVGYHDLAGDLYEGKDCPNCHNCGQRLEWE